jgi:threonine aldolase
MIDLYSDTVTQPTDVMRSVIAKAVVGDEQRGEDPTTQELEIKVCQLLKKERALFLPSATMANAIAIQLHCGPGDELLAAENSHVLSYESGGAAVHARATVRGIPAWTGIFGRNAVTDRLRMEMPHSPKVRLVILENTTNQGGGRPWPLDKLDDVTSTSKANGLSLHLDGSRLFNASIATGESLERLARDFNTTTLCFSKGLGCPMGAVLVLPDALYTRARKLKQLMGGALRQSGMMASAALYALDHHVERLADDHRVAELLFKGLSEVKPLVVEQIPLRTNMVFFELPDRYSAEQFEELLLQQGVRFSRVQRQRFRAVTHLNVAENQVEQIVDSCRRACQALLSP